MNSELKGKIKSFWARPEGKVGMIAAAILAFAGFIGFIHLLPFLVTTAVQLLFLGGVGAFLFLLTRPTTHVLFQIVCRKITSAVIKIDPLEILKMKVRDMESNLEKMSESLTSLKQSLTRLARKIQQNLADLQANMEKASYAKKQGESEAMYLASRKAGRREKSNMTLKELYEKIERMHNVLTKIYKNSAIVIEDTKDEIDVTEEEYKAVKAANSAMKSAMSAINGNKDRRAIYEEAYEVLAEDIANKSGELTQMMEMSDSLMKNIDLDQGMMEERGMKMIEEWEKKADAWLQNSTTKSDAITKVSGQASKKPLSAQVEEVVDNTNQFSNLFNK